VHKVGFLNRYIEMHKKKQYLNYIDTSLLDECEYHFEFRVPK